MFWRDGSQVDHVSVTDRSFQYGDGCFTTILTKSGKMQLWDQHVKRMERALSQLKISPVDWHKLKSDIDKLASPKVLAGIKIHVSRGEGGRGYSPNVNRGPLITLSQFEFPASYIELRRSGLEMTLCDISLGLNPLLAGLKHNNRLEQILAKEHVERSGHIDGIVLDIEGNVIETTMANIFWFKDGVLHTPSLKMAGVEGVMRGEVLRIVAQDECPIVIDSFKLSTLKAADEIFVSNCILGVAPVTKIQDAQFPIGNMTRRIQEKLGQ
ncbi:Aminodeoxychorismate lyase [Vibrio thalassae]|uniref:Aminodeoxychorismate lyase n=1 Tax=Vibrio thalassae TaxID=1243014 RepID=A0A240EET4_9VIBR|nr:aminodeoxychorismate lyase [Vibrio thalassae]SNX47056.1 Aminodeoxychorismate lyase [Vibrio thalassae]